MSNALRARGLFVLTTEPDTADFGHYLSSLSPNGRIVLTDKSWSELLLALSYHANRDMRFIKVACRLLSVLMSVKCSTKVWICSPTKNEHYELRELLNIFGIFNSNILEPFAKTLVNDTTINNEYQFLQWTIFGHPTKRRNFKVMDITGNWVEFSSTDKAASYLITNCLDDLDENDKQKRINTNSTCQKLHAHFSKISDARIFGYPETNRIDLESLSVSY